MFSTKRSALCFILALLLFASCLAPCAYAEGEMDTTVTYSSPAICTDIGKKVTFDEYSVQFTYGGDAESGDKIKWTLDGKEVDSFTPDKAGVTALTAVCNGVKKNIYVVAKDPKDTEYVLYFNDFSSDPKDDLRIIQQTTGTKVSHDASNGTLVLDASNDGGGYVRVLFPKYLDDFGDLVYHAAVKISNPKGSNTRYSGLMYRVQNNDYPYMQVTLRYDSTASNGVEIARRTEADAWSVMQKGPAEQTKDQMTDLCADVAGNVTEFSVNGKVVLTEKATLYSDGAVGLQVRGAKMTVDSVKITVNSASSMDGEKIAGGFVKVRDVESNVSMAPVIVSEISEKEQLDKIHENSPAVAIFTYAATEAGNQVVLGFDSNGIVGDTIDNVLKVLDGKIIPAFRVASEAAADALAEYAKKNDLRDMYVLSDDASLVTRAWKAWNYLRGIVDYSSYSGTDFEVVRNSVVAAGARVVIVPTSSMTKENVAYLQDKYLCAWAAVGETEAENVAAINCGVLGLITGNRAVTEMCLTKFYPKDTLIQTPNIIGHRGVPSLAQENSMDSAKKAFEAGATMVENDIYVAADGVLVVMHDDTIDRTTDGTGKVTSFTSKQLEQYKIDVNADVPAEPIPTLEDYFKEFKGNGKTIVIEMKSNNTSVAMPLSKLIAQYDILDQVMVISFYPEVIKALRKLIPGISAAYLNQSIAPSEDISLFVTQQVLETIQQYNTGYSPNYSDGALGKKMITDLLRRGVTTWPYTINKQDDFDKYFVMGIRSMTTNYSQWASNYFCGLTAEADSDGKYTVTAEKYIGKTVDVTSKANLVVVDDGGTGIGFDASTGKFTFASGSNGTAKVFFTYSAYTSSATRYTLVTKLLTVNCVSDDSGDTGDETTANSGNRGCRSLSAVCVLPAVICAAAAVGRRRRESDAEN